LANIACSFGAERAIADLMSTWTDFFSMLRLNVAAVSIGAFFVCHRGPNTALLEIPTRLSLGVVRPKNDENLGDAFFSEVEVFNLLLGHANENFGQTGIGLLLHEGC
jgi:hypothetical protein